MKHLPGPMLLALLLLTGACSSAEVTPTSTNVGTSTTTTTTLRSTTTTSTTTTTLPPGIDLSQYQWVVHGLDGIRSPEGLLVWATQPIAGSRNLARDGLGGIAFVDISGLWWLAAGAAEPRLVTTDHDRELIEVIVEDRTPIAHLGHCDPIYVRLTDGEQVTRQSEGRVEVNCAEPWSEVWTASNGMSAQVTAPVTELDAEGQPHRVLAPARLIITRDGETLLDLPIGGAYETWARLHDFDGQRLIVSRGPFEPALPEESFFVFDLGCGICIQMFTASAATATLVGPDVDWSGPIEQPVYLGFEATPLLTDEGITGLDEGRYLVFIDHVSGSGDTLGLDLAVWFSGNEANHIAMVDGVAEVPVPGDFYIRNADATILELPVSRSVEVTSVWYDYGTDPDLENDPIAYEDLLAVLASDVEDVRSNMRYDPWWITVEKGVVVNLDEQYVP